MNGGKRAYDILRGYINHEWERIQSVVERDAEAELNEAIEGPVPTRSGDAPIKHVAVSDEDSARQILGVGPQATFEEIRAAFD